MKIEIVDSIEKLLLYEAEWKSILKEMNNDIVFLEPDWIMYWWKFFGDKHHLFVLLAINDQEVAGICPLMVTKKRICSEISFIGSKESDSMDFILRNECREEALECICNFLRNLKGQNIIKFHGISDMSENYTSLKKYFKAGKVAFVSSDIHCYYLHTKGSDFNAHFENRFSKKTRETMNNKEKKLKRLGVLDYKKVAPSEIDDVFEIHDKRWLRKIGNSSFSKGDAKEFHKELALEKSMPFNTIVDAVTLNNRIISFMYGFEYNKKYYFIRIAHDDDFFFLSPGELVLKKKVEECFNSQISVLDFGTGNDPYKAKWTDYYKEVYRITFPSNSLLSKLIFYIKYWAVMKLKNGLRKNERIYKFRKYSLGRLKLLLSRAYISERAARIKKNVGQDGLLLYLIQLINNQISNIYSSKQYLLLERNITNLEVSPNSLYVKEAAIDDLDTLSQVMNESPSRIIRRFVNKHKCFITLVGSEVINYCWVNCSNIEISSAAISIPLKKSEAHIYNVFTEKKYKNEHNYINIFTHIFNLLYKEKYSRCYITLNNCNKSLENEIYKKIFHPRVKVLEKRVFGTIKHSVIDL